MVIRRWTNYRILMARTLTNLKLNLRIREAVYAELHTVQRNTASRWEDDMSITKSFEIHSSLLSLCNFHEMKLSAQTHTK